jgi:tripartite-type tricarboxylate transporter receptor subunit TctC
MFKFILSLLFCVCTITNAQTVQIVVPFVAGGGADRAARALEKNLTKRVPYNFIIEYQLGAGGIIASNNVAKNYSKDVVLLVHSAAIATNASNPNSTYNLTRDFIPVAKFGSVPMVLIANRHSTILTIKDLKSLKNPTFYATGGVGTANHVAGELLSLSINQDLTPVFYKGESAALNDILSNNVPMMFISASTVPNFSNISILAITGTQRNTRLPDVPTFTEQGVRGFERSPNWLVVLASPGSDQSIISQIKTALSESYVDNQDIELYNRTGIDITRQPVTHVTEFLAEEIQRIQKLQARMKLQK